MSASARMMFEDDGSDRCWVEATPEGCVEVHFLIRGQPEGSFRINVEDVGSFCEEIQRVAKETGKQTDALGGSL